MKIYIDADACPKAIKEILFKAANRHQIELLVVANNAIYIPRSQFIKFVQVELGPDIADDYIAGQVKENDLVITADIPLADRVISNNAFALNPRGELYTKANIKQVLSIRNFMQEVRDTGINTSGPKPLHQRDIQEFANSLDRFLARNR